MKNLEEFLMNYEVNGNLGDFLELDDLFPENGVEPLGVPSDSESDMGIGSEDFSGNLEDLLDEQAPQFGIGHLTNHMQNRICNEYKRDEKLIEWITHGDASVHGMS
ncbi:hypothetical protein Tco_0003612 [Tanacetum coccineum]